MQNAIDATRKEYESEYDCKVSYYFDRENSGNPLVLIHSINAAPSSFEMKPLFEHYRKDRPVYSLDLPGFGFSERSDRLYSFEFYANVINEFITKIIGVPCDVIAFSLSSEFAARATLANDKFVRSLAIISPTGLSNRKMPDSIRGEKIRRVLSKAPWGDAIYKLLTNKRTIRYFLNRNYVTTVPEEMVEYAYITSNQSGAKHAPYYFLSGQLFTQSACSKLYELLNCPVLVLYDKDPNVSFSSLPAMLVKHLNWSASRIAPTLGIPQWEQPDKTISALDQFWEKK